MNVFENAEGRLKEVIACVCMINPKREMTGDL
jgi:hypothetical protein